MGSFFKLSDSQILKPKPILRPPVCVGGTAVNPRPPPHPCWLCAAHQTPPADTADLPTAACSKAHLKQHKNIHWLHLDFGAVPRSTGDSLMAPKNEKKPLNCVSAIRQQCCTLSAGEMAKSLFPECLNFSEMVLAFCSFQHFPQC